MDDGWMDGYVLLTLRQTTPHSLLYPLLMLSVAKMYLEILHRHPWPWRIQLPRTVVAADPRQILVLESLSRLCGVGVCYREHRLHVNCRVAHHTLERVIRIVLLQLRESRHKPVRRRRLCGRTSVLIISAGVLRRPGHHLLTPDTPGWGGCGASTAPICCAGPV